MSNQQVLTNDVNSKKAEISEKEKHISEQEQLLSQEVANSIKAKELMSETLAEAVLKYETIR